MAVVQSADRPAGGDAKRHLDWKALAANWSTIAIFVVLVLVASFISTSFLSSRNVENVLRQVVSTGVISMGMLLVILTGVIGAIVVTPLMNALKITDYAARGFAAGLASHGIGTARAFTVDPVAGAFAGIAMGLNAVVTPVLVPVILPWLVG